MTTVSNKIPLSLPQKYSDLVGPLSEWGRKVIGLVEDKADTAQSTADGAQSDATLSLEEVSALATANEAALKEIAFRRHWDG